MKSATVAAVAAMIVIGSSAHADTLVFEQSGATMALDLWMVPLPGAGDYRIEVESSLPVTFQLSGGWTLHWDIFVAPPPRPHDEFLDGNTSDFATGQDFFGTSAQWSFAVPITSYDFFEAGTEYEWRGIPAGTPLYYEEKYEDPYIRAYVDDMVDSQEFNYRFSIYQVAAVPEPATWAMMITGFGLAGAAVRRRPARC